MPIYLAMRSQSEPLYFSFATMDRDCSSAVQRPSARTAGWNERIRFARSLNLVGGREVILPQVALLCVAHH